MLLDIHAYPGGSASGSYNGVFPSPPVFFLNETLMALGDAIVQRLCDFVTGLPDATRAVIAGVTLMNEPCHSLPEQGDVMLRWLGRAVATYRERVVAPTQAAGAAPPTLFVQVCSAPFGSVRRCVQFGSVRFGGVFGSVRFGSVRSDDDARIALSDERARRVAVVRRRARRARERERESLARRRRRDRG